MPIPLGVFAVAGAVAPVAAGNAYELLETEILAGTAASVTFDNLGDYSTDYQHLQIRMTARNSSSDGPSAFVVRLNGDTGSNYAWHNLFANGSSVSSSAGTSVTYAIAGVIPDNSGTANVFNAAIIDILDAFETTKFTTIRTLSGHNSSNGQRVSLYSGLWRNTASLTSITIFSDFGGNIRNLVAGSRFSLYGLRSS